MLTPADETPVAPAPTRGQVAAQHLAVAHLARQVAATHAELAVVYGLLLEVPLDPGFIDLLGRNTARRMEVLGDMLNGMDAVTEEDAWVDPVFAVARATWPAAPADEPGA